MKILVTGAAGFIGFFLCKRLVKEGHEVVGLDNINNYYDVNLKYARLNELGIRKEAAEKVLNVTSSSLYGDQLQFIKMDLEDRTELPKLFSKFNFEMVCNLAAQAGVRYSIENPNVYVDSNVVGFLNVLECCRHHHIKRLVYASSSSIYGNSKKVPFKETDNVDHPISLYAATKKANELMAHTYSHLYGFETIGVRFFTVYGPWSRPDMALFLFTDAIVNNRPIKVFNNGQLSRDFTYIDDIINGVMQVILNKSNNNQLYKIYNVGNGKPQVLGDFIKAIEQSLGKVAEKVYLPMQQGDVKQTWADCSKLEMIGAKNKVSIEEGVALFVAWYKKYKNLKK